MDNKFTSKIADFESWSANAVNHYRKGLYADALINMRKSGEAACKLMFYFRFNEKTAYEKTQGKSYKELIEAVSKHNLAPFKVINWLETMHVHGNESAHDAQIDKDQCEYALKALGFLVDWVFTKCIKSLVPAHLKKSFSLLKQPAIQDNANIDLQKELKRITKEKEELENLLRSVAGKNTNEAEKINKLAGDLEKSIDRLKELEQTKEQEKEEITVVNLNNEAKQGKRFFFTKKNILLIGSAFALCLALILFFFYVPGLLKNKNISNADTTIAVDSFHVLILPLTLMQDNPNLTINFEDALDRTLRQNIKKENIPVSVYIDRTSRKSALTADEALNIGVKQKANVIIYGEIYEPLSSTDSTQVNIKFSITQKGDTVKEQLGLKSFLHLSDSSAIKIQMYTASFIDLCYSVELQMKKKYNRELALLYDIKPMSKTQKTIIYQFLTEAHIANKNFTTALFEIEKYIKLDSLSEIGYFYKGELLFYLKDFKEAEIYFKKALAIKRNYPQALLGYADFLASPVMNQQAESEKILLEALQYDSTITNAWLYLGELGLFEKNFKVSEKYFRKTLSLDPGNLEAKACLAQILAFYLNKPEEAETLMISVIRKNYKYPNALTILADIYGSDKLYNPEKAKLLLEYAKKLQPSDNDVFTLCAKGNEFIKKNDYINALKCLLKAFVIDSSEMNLNTNVARCYFNLKNYDKALYYNGRAWKMDSLDYLNNYNRGFIYYHSDKKHFDEKKAISFYERALKTNPDDSTCLTDLADMYTDIGDYSKSKQTLNTLITLDHSNSAANLKLGQIYEKEGNFTKASVCFATVISAKPNWDVAQSGYAKCLVQISIDNYSVALEHAKKAALLQPGNADYYSLLSQIYIQGKDWVNAWDNYEKAIQLYPAYKDLPTEQYLQKMVKGY